MFKIWLFNLFYLTNGVITQGISYQQLEYYYNKTIGTGDYYKLSEVIRIIQDSNYSLRLKTSSQRFWEPLSSIGAYGGQEKRVNIVQVASTDI